MKKLEIDEITDYLNYITKDRNKVGLEISHEKLVEDYNNFFTQITSICTVKSKEQIDEGRITKLNKLKNDIF